MKERGGREGRGGGGMKERGRIIDSMIR